MSRFYAKVSILSEGANDQQKTVENQTSYCDFEIIYLYRT